MTDGCSGQATAASLLLCKSWIWDSRPLQDFQRSTVSLVSPAGVLQVSSFWTLVLPLLAFAQRKFWKERHQFIINCNDVRDAVVDTVLVAEAAAAFLGTSSSVHSGPWEAQHKVQPVQFFVKGKVGMSTSVVRGCLEEVLSQVVGTDGLDVYATMNGKILDLRSTLSSCGITGGCTVHIHFRLRGGSREDVRNASRRVAGQCVRGAIGVVRQGRICLSLPKGKGMGKGILQLGHWVEKANYEKQEQKHLEMIAKREHNLVQQKAMLETVRIQLAEVRDTVGALRALVSETKEPPVNSVVPPLPPPREPPPPLETDGILPTLGSAQDFLPIDSSYSQIDLDTDMEEETGPVQSKTNKKRVLMKLRGSSSSFRRETVKYEASSGKDLARALAKLSPGGMSEFVQSVPVNVAGFLMRSAH